MGLLSGSGLTRRYQTADNSGAPPPPPDQLQQIIDPPPKTKPAFQFLALVLIIAFSCLQFFPATHIRHPSDPHRTWIPIAGSSRISTNLHVHVVTWIDDCLDLLPLAVLINSTLTTSTSPEKLYFHIFLPQTEEEKLSFYKLKVLFPDSNLEIISQKEIREKTMAAAEEGEDEIWRTSFQELAPFLISTIKPSLTRFIYVSPDAIIKESMEQVFTADTTAAAAEDCKSVLGNHVNIEIVNAIQRTAAKPWVSGKPYNSTACMPDLNLILLDNNDYKKKKKNSKRLLESILWWNKVLNNKGKNRSTSLYASIALALYNGCLKLDEFKVSPFDGPRRQCSKNGGRRRRSRVGDDWRQYLSPKSQLILAH